VERDVDIPETNEKTPARGVSIVPASLFMAATSALEKANLSPHRIIERAGLPMWHYSDPEALVPGTHYYRLYAAGARAFGSESFGGIVPSLLPIKSYGVVGRHIGHAVTIHDAIQTTTDDMNRLTTATRLRTAEYDGQFWWTYGQMMDTQEGSRQLELASISYMIDIVRLGAGPSWAPDKVGFHCARIPGVDRLEQFADADVRWGQRISGMEIPRSLLSRKITSTQPSTGHTTAGSLTDPEPADEFIPSLRQVIRSYLSFGNPPLAEIADAAGLGARTLQRRLAEEGLTYKKVVDQSRFQAAADLLRDPAITLTEISFQLAYSDPSHFHHAFRRWAGVTPSQYRLQLESE